MHHLHRVARVSQDWDRQESRLHWVLECEPCCSDETPQQMQTAEERAHLALPFRVTVQHQGSVGRELTLDLKQKSQSVTARSL